MGKIVVTEFITLDGVIKDPGGGEQDEFDRGGWAFRFERGPEGDAFKLDELMNAEAQLLGRKTFEGFAAAWPERTDEMGFADKFNSMPKYVVSSTLAEPSWENSHVISLDDVASLRDKHEGDILVAGSATLVRGLLANGLVDELHLMIFPVVLGAGQKLFDEGAEIPFEIVETIRSGEVSTLILRPKS
jgi:dihydrofolate reductase